jgi:hypothetical protein
VDRIGQGTRVRVENTGELAVPATGSCVPRGRLALVLHRSRTAARVVRATATVGGRSRHIAVRTRGRSTRLVVAGIGRSRTRVRVRILFRAGGRDATVTVSGTYRRCRGRRTR